MPFVTTRDGCRIHFDHRGEGHGSAVLLIMGFMTPGTAWFHQVETLQHHHHVIWLDNRGCGGSDAPQGPYSMGQFALDCMAVLDAVGVQQAHIVGMSMGGMIAQHVALNHRPRCSSLTLMGTHAGGPQTWIPPLPTLFFGARTIVPSKAVRLSGFERLLFPRDWLTPERKQELRPHLERDYGKPVAIAPLLAQHAAMRGHDTRPRLAQLAGLPTLVIQPGRDHMVRPKFSLELHRLIPGAKLLALQHSGHGVVRQFFQEVNHALQSHFGHVDHPRASHAASHG
jgi:3-oxoadipate enol-lactonase